MPEYIQLPGDGQSQIERTIAKRTGWVRGVTSNMARDLVALIESWRTTGSDPQPDLHDHEWVPCANCPNPHQPCACAGGVCCDAEQGEQT